MNEHMIRRTIMIFPEFDNINIINGIREKYDPLAEHVRPHISCIFKFESNLTSDEIKKHLEDILNKAYEDVKDIADVFSTVVKKVSVEIVDANKDSIIETEYILL